MKEQNLAEELDGVLELDGVNELDGVLELDGVNELDGFNDADEELHHSEKLETIQAPLLEDASLDNIPSSSLNEVGCRELVAAIVENAILDYKELERKGIVKRGKMVRKLKGKNEVDDYPTDHAVEFLLHWFKDGEEMKSLLNMADIKVHSDFIQHHLGIAL